MTVWYRTRVAPFEAAICAIIVIQAILGLTGHGSVNPIDVLLPAWMALGFMVLYLVAGLLVLVGLVAGLSKVEAAGLTLLASLVLARGFMFGTLLGWGESALITVAFSVCIAAACVFRLHTLLRVVR